MSAGKLRLVVAYKPRINADELLILDGHRILLSLIRYRDWPGEEDLHGHSALWADSFKHGLMTMKLADPTLALTDILGPLQFRAKPALQEAA